MTNLDIPAEEWLRHQFEHEYCAECGGDENHHDAVPFMGNWFARCRYTPHPDYPAEVWTEPEVESEVKTFIISAASDAVILTDGIMEILNRHGYDSIDRELAFWYASQMKGVDYEALYQRWVR